ncbi:MAG: ABC transporter [Candidatus Anoxymicrobium japonicum]|uniref:ABC transporter n=1 Tax=Candidatus Anoxymicrobium japonicum TaxID=2013648 RepID=A0A2N3G4B8_9ACTN|nr:MAG: ABC transporter [Candidatus Anoxymicrobium japonicum]
MAAISVRNLHKNYGTLKAVDGVSFEVKDREIFGILGPNGAGKTTTLEMIETLREPDSGDILVDGIEVRKNEKKIKEIIGVQLQNTAFFDNLSVYENVDLFGSFYSNRRPVNELLEMVDLQDKKNSMLSELSGGQHKRVSIVLALVNDPRVVFLDEPTTGLDPQARRNIWEIIENLKAREKTVVITTHYIEEAERLCDRVAIMDHGKIIDIGTPAELVRRYSPESDISFKLAPEIDRAVIEKITGARNVRNDGGGGYIVTTGTPRETLLGILTAARENGANVDNISMKQASLEDVFLKMTGRRIRE